MAVKAVVLGSLNADLVAEVPRAPYMGESLLAERFSVLPGGKGANQACTLSRLGAEVTILGAVGQDGHAALLRESLRKAGVDDSRLDGRADAPTGVAMIAVCPGGGNSIISVLGANARLDRAYIDRNLDLLRGCDVLVLQLEIPPEVAAYAAERARAFGKLVVLDPAPVPPQLPDGLLRSADLVKPNEVELGLLTGIPDAEQDLERAVARLKEMGARSVLVTLGGQGCCVALPEGGLLRIPARPVQAVDTTAAGDAFTAAAAIRLAEGDSLPQAAAFATEVASIVVTRRGAQSSIPTREELEALLRRTAPRG